MTPDERITALEERVDALEQENEACQKALGKLLTRCQQVIETMQPALVTLSLRGQALRAWDETEPPLTKEEVGELYIRYSRAARKVEDTFTNVLVHASLFTL
jgi:hypothetical protein